MGTVWQRPVNRALAATVAPTLAAGVCQGGRQARAHKGERSLGGGVTIVVSLEGQLRLDDQPVWHRAATLARRQPGACLIALACRPEGQRLRGPHQRRLAAAAQGSLQVRLAAAGIPLHHLPQHSPDQALELLGPTLRPDVVLKGQESRLFADWPLPAETFPLVFSDFRRSLRVAPLPPLPLPPLQGVGEGLPSAPSSPAACDPRSAFPFAGDEPTALARLQHYFFDSDGLRTYKATRNGLVGTAFSSKFSPFLSIGALSVRRLWHGVLQYQERWGADEGSEAMKQELLWREFFLWSEQRHGAAFHAPSGVQDRLPEWEEDRERFLRWTKGDSGHPLIDAQLNELLATGYLSNRGRQWVASHFINELRLPWTWGARFFEWALIDAHPALNAGNWAYLAGVGSDPRSFGGSPRRFDLERQRRLYDPENLHRRRWA